MIFEYQICASCPSTQIFIPVFINPAVVRRDDDLASLWMVDSGVEALSVLLYLPLSLPVFRMLWRSSKFHRNFRNLLLYLQLVGYVSNVGRAYLLAYEGSLLFEFETRLDVPQFVVFSSILRLLSMGAHAFFVPMLCLERIFATLFIADYEQNGRTLQYNLCIVASCLTTVSVVFAGMLIIVIFPVAALITACVVFALMTLVTAVLYLWILRASKKALFWIESLQKDSRAVIKAPLGLTEYNLSLRYQLRETLRIMEIIKVLVLTTVLNHAFGIALGYCVLSFDRTRRLTQVLAMIYNMLLTVYCSAFLLGVTLIIREFRVKYFEQWAGILGLRKAESSVEPSIANPNNVQLETQAYFDYYMKDW